VPARRAANATGVPIRFLIREGDAGRVPMVRAGRRRLFDVAAVLAALAASAKATKVGAS
jgi:hypothetical protein